MLVGVSVSTAPQNPKRMENMNQVARSKNLSVVMLAGVLLAVVLVCGCPPGGGTDGISADSGI